VVYDAPEFPRNPASRLTPAGSVTCAPTWGAGSEPVFVTVNATIPVAPCGSAPTGLIRTLNWPSAPGAGAAAAGGEPANGPTDGRLVSAEDGSGLGGAG